MRKKIQRISAVAKIKCSNCGKISLRKVPKDSSPQYFDCDKCGQRMQTPITSCCIICAYTKKRCVPVLLQEAYKKGLEVRFQS